MEHFSKSNLIDTGWAPEIAKLLCLGEWMSHEAHELGIYVAFLLLVAMPGATNSRIAHR